MKLFQTIAALLAANCMMTIVIRKNENGKLVVSTSFNNEKVQDEAKKMLVPFVVSGTPEELDNEYASVIGQPMEEAKGIQTSMANFEAQQKVAQANSAAAKAKKTAEANAKTEGEKKSKDLVTKADALIKEKKYKEALKLLEQALPLAAASAKTDIQKKIDDCKKKDTPDLFAAFGEEAPQETPAETAEEPAEETEESEAPEAEEETPSDDEESASEENTEESSEDEETAIEFAEETPSAESFDD